jgi:hypothetical protein
VKDPAEAHPRLGVASGDGQLECPGCVKPPLLFGKDVAKVESRVRGAQVGCTPEAHLRLRQPTQFGKGAPKVHQFLEVITCRCGSQSDLKRYVFHADMMNHARPDMPLSARALEAKEGSTAILNAC